MEVPDDYTDLATPIVAKINAAEGELEALLVQVDEKKSYLKTLRAALKPLQGKTGSQPGRQGVSKEETVEAIRWVLTHERHLEGDALKEAVVSRLKRETKKPATGLGLHYARALLQVQEEIRSDVDADAHQDSNRI